MTTEDHELKELANDLHIIANVLWEEEIELDRLMDRKPTNNGEPTKTNNLDWKLINNTRRLVMLAAEQLHDLRVDLEARMD